MWFSRLHNWLFYGSTDVLLIKKILFWPKNAKTGNIKLGKFLFKKKKRCSQFWSFWVLNSTFWILGPTIIFSTSMIFWTFSCVSRHYVHKYLNYAYEHYTQKKFHDNRDNLALSKKINPFFYAQNGQSSQISFIGKIMTSFWKFFYMLNCENK